MGSPYEQMRTDDANWKFVVIYRCLEDPRLVVRNRYGPGWAWNFGNPRTAIAIVLAVAVFLLPAALAYYLGVQSPLVLGALLLFALVLVVLWANQNSRDPDPSIRKPADHGK